jgi:hypothetical protein
VGSQIFVSQAEPEVWVKKAQSLKEIEAFGVQPPSSAIVSSVGQVVDDCVDVGADGQTEQSDVVADITNIGEHRWVADVADATSESAPPSTAAYRANHDTSYIIYCHIAYKATCRNHTAYALGRLLRRLEPFINYVHWSLKKVYTISELKYKLSIVSIHHVSV